MMEHQWTMEARGALKRLILLLTVAVAMTLMVAFAPGPAIAKTTDHQPPGPPSTSGGDHTKNNGSVMLHGDHPVCVVHNKNGLPTGYSGKCPIT